MIECEQQQKTAPTHHRDHHESQGDPLTGGSRTLENPTPAPRILHQQSSTLLQMVHIPRGWPYIVHNTANPHSQICNPSFLFFEPYITTGGHRTRHTPTPRPSHKSSQPAAARSSDSQDSARPSYSAGNKKAATPTPPPHHTTKLSPPAA